MSPSFPRLSAVEVVHSIPGRLRLRLLPGEAAAGAALAQSLASEPGVGSVRWSPLTSSLTVVYDPRRKPSDIFPLVPAAAFVDDLPGATLAWDGIAADVLTAAAGALALEVPVEVLRLVAGKGALSSVLLWMVELLLSLALGELVGITVAALLGQLLASRDRAPAARRPTALAAA